MTNLVSKLFAFLLLLVVFVANPALASTYATLDAGDCGQGASNTLSNGNLTYTKTGNEGATCMGSISKSSGKWYWEMQVDTSDATYNWINSGISQYASAFYLQCGYDPTHYGYRAEDGNKINNNSSGGYGATFSTSDVISTALDMDNGTIEMFVNGASQGVMYTGLSGSFHPCISIGGYSYNNYDPASFTGQVTMNFGQNTFQYSVPSGFEPGLCAESTCSGSPPTPTSTPFFLATGFPDFYDAHKIAIMWVGACMLLVGFVHIFFQVGKSVLQWLKFNS